jgi:hypothetical protein
MNPPPPPPPPPPRRAVLRAPGSHPATPRARAASRTALAAALRIFRPLRAASRPSL